MQIESSYDKMILTIYHFLEEKTHDKNDSYTEDEKGHTTITPLISCNRVLICYHILLISCHRLLIVVTDY